MSRRERQIMDVIYARGQASAAEVKSGWPDPPSYSAVRALLRILENKGHLKHRQEQSKYIYLPVRPRGHAARQALRGLLKTFFDNSTVRAAAALLDASDTNLSDEELAEISELIEKARNRGANP
jgi:predicted transcriptional regulator